MSFNEWPKDGISQRAFETDFKGNFSSVPDPLEDLKYEVANLDKAALDWWQPRGEAAAAVVHYPLSASPEEWSTAILYLDQFLVEGFLIDGLRKRLTATAVTFDPKWGSVRLLQACFELSGCSEIEAKAAVEPLKRLHTLRTKVKGHSAHQEKEKLIRQARAEHGSLAANFRALAEAVKVAFFRSVQVVKILRPGASAHHHYAGGS